MASRWSNFFTGIAVTLFIAGSGLALVALILTSPNPIVREAKAQPFGPIYCSQTASLVGVTTKAQIVAAPATGSASILVCGYVVSNLTGPVTVSFQAGTGSNCATNSVAVGPTLLFGSATGGISNDENGIYRGFRVANPNALCVTSPTIASNVTVYYALQ